MGELLPRIYCFPKEGPGRFVSPGKEIVYLFHNVTFQSMVKQCAA
jgi:hypothetical protein